MNNIKKIKLALQLCISTVRYTYWCIVCAIDHQRLKMDDLFWTTLGKMVGMKYKDDEP
jgi:hypothetical protein